MVTNHFKNDFDKLVVVTKYGYVSDVVEDIYIEDGILENVEFTSDIKKADLFSSEKSTAPKYARGVGIWDTLDKWMNVIGGEKVEVKIAKSNTDAETFVDGVKIIKNIRTEEFIYRVPQMELDGFLEYEYIENK